MVRLCKHNLVFATVLRFDISRDELAERPMVCFVVENSNTDYWDLIEFCRLGNYEVDKHNRKTVDRHYFVVFGPVSLWPQSHVMKDCDQISFHEPGGLRILQGPELLRRPTIATQATPEDPLFPFP
jgi:hypothetical protein